MRKPCNPCLCIALCHERNSSTDKPERWHTSSIVIMLLSTAATTEALRRAVQRLVSGGGKWTKVALVCRKTSPFDAP